MSPLKPLCIDLKGGRVQFDAADEALIRSLTGWHVSRQGYAVAFTWKPRRATLMHRLLTGAPSGTHVDHINGDKLDNRRCNLRVVTPALNQANRKCLNRNNSSGVRGVAHSPHRSKPNPWTAQITVSRKNVFLGRFPTKEAAAQARRAAELEHYGEACP